tara:strand:- start:588 stop:785 length:198 start_codon:yes stop_codon:yes gene_type:complete
MNNYEESVHNISLTGYEISIILSALDHMLNIWNPASEYTNTDEIFRKLETVADNWQGDFEGESDE